MAQIVDKFPSTAKPFYDWDNWLNGCVWKLVKGSDFLVDPEQFRTTCIRQANRRKVRAVFRKDGDSVVYIQARKKTHE